MRCCRRKASFQGLYMKPGLSSRRLRRLSGSSMPAQRDRGVCVSSGQGWPEEPTLPTTGQGKGEAGPHLHRGTSPATASCLQPKCASSDTSAQLGAGPEAPGRRGRRAPAGRGGRAGAWGLFNESPADALRPCATWGSPGSFLPPLNRTTVQLAAVPITTTAQEQGQGASPCLFSGNLSRWLCKVGKIHPRPLKVLRPAACPRTWPGSEPSLLPGPAHSASAHWLLIHIPFDFCWGHSAFAMFRLHLTIPLISLYPLYV